MAAISKIMIDLTPEQKMVALGRLDDLMTLEQLSHVPEAAPERRH